MLPFLIYTCHLNPIKMLKNNTDIEYLKVSSTKMLIVCKDFGLCIHLQGISNVKCSISMAKAKIHVSKHIHAHVQEM
jgi:hypothetical protein